MNIESLHRRSEASSKIPSYTKVDNISYTLSPTMPASPWPLSVRNVGSVIEPPESEHRLREM